MSAGFESAHGADSSGLLDEANSHLFRTQAVLLGSVGHWARIPTRGNRNKLDNADDLATEAFAIHAKAVVLSDMDNQEKAVEMARIYFDIRSQRLGFLLSLAPNGDFAPLMQTEKQMVGSILEGLKERDEVGTAERHSDAYQQETLTDLGAVERYIKATPKGKTIAALGFIGLGLVEMGKQTVCTTAGSLIAQKISKKYGL